MSKELISEEHERATSAESVYTRDEGGAQAGRRVGMRCKYSEYSSGFGVRQHGHRMHGAA